MTLIIIKTLNITFPGHQIINTMKTLSYISEVNDVEDARKRVEYAVRMSVFPLSVTTLCHAVPFAVAVASKYYAIKLVGIYMGNHLR
jgi:NADH:ubiquinone oxidoreductase subunit B-like Fe-S oxidoreductase